MANGHAATAAAGEGFFKEKILLGMDVKEYVRSCCTPFHAVAAIILAVGTPAAYLLATRGFPGRRLVITLVELPLVLPPAVAGIGLLAAFGRSGLLGGELAALVGQADGAVEPLEQAHRQLRLQRLDLAADGARRDREFLRGFAEAAVPSCGLEGAQGVQGRKAMPHESEFLQF